MGIKLKNNAFSTLASSISASNTGIVVAAGEGARFPTLASGDYFYATLESTGGTTEIVKVTARSGDTMTIVRAQEGTSAQSFLTGSRIELRVTVGNVEGGTYTPSGTNAVARTLQEKIRETVSVNDFGAVGDGVTNDQPACQAAINAVRAAGGGTVYFPEGQYLLTGVSSADSKLNGLLVPYTSANGTSQRVVLQGEGKSTILLANSDNMYVVRYSDSHGGVCDMTISGNGKSNVVGLGCVPENTTQTSTIVFQLYNEFSGLYILNCAEGFTMKTGPDVGGGDSGCWYNVLKDTHIFQCTRGIWLQDGPNAGCSPCNRNTFINVRCGQSMNTGLQIDSGDTNKFYAVNFEGITSGTSPNATPTAIYIAQTSPVGGFDNNGNAFFGTTVEGATRDISNFNGRTSFFGINVTGAKINTAGGAGVGLVMLGGDDASQVPQVWGGGVYQLGGQLPAFNNGLTFNSLSGTARVETNGAFISTTSFQEVSGASGSLANGASFTITVPTLRRPYLLFLYSGTNLTQPGVYLVCGDGVVSVNVDNIVSSAIITVSGTAANQITVTNSSGAPSVIRYTLTPFGIVFPP